MRIPNVLALLTSCVLLSVNVTADFDKGSAAWKAGDYDTSLREWKPSAEQGDAVAQNNLAR